MSDSASVSGATDGPLPDDRSLYLANVVREALAGRPATWIVENAVDPETGIKPFTKQTAAALIREPRRDMPRKDLQRALAQCFGWSERYIWDVCAFAIGAPEANRPSFADLVPAGIDKLSVKRQLLFRDLLVAAVEDHEAAHPE